MTRPARSSADQQLLDMLNQMACGRNFDEEVASITGDGNHGTSASLRAGVLAAHGIKKPQGKASNAIMFSCYMPFYNPFLLRDYLRILDLLEADYTYLDQEYCCGVPLFMQSEGPELELARATGAANIRRNWELARQQGADRLVYCCVGCAHTAQELCPDEAGRHIYIADLLVEALAGKTLKVPPTVVGYFEGCHTAYRSFYPQAGLSWSAYRQLLGRIEGLVIVDVPNSMCCKQAAAKIVEEAQQLKVDRLLCSCNACQIFLAEAASGKVAMVTFPELILQGLQYDRPQ